jgi:hypothetical protein
VITIPTGDFTGLLADVIPFADTDEQIPSTNCVCLEWVGAGLAALATDRYRIAISEWEPGDIGKDEAIQDDLFSDWGSGDDPWRTTIDLADAKELVKVFKLSEKEYSVPLTVDYEQPRARLTVKRDRNSGHSAITIVLETTEVEFPSVRALLGKNDTLEPVTSLGYSAKLLADFGKVRARGPLEMSFTGREGLTHVRIGERFVGAIMPVRIGEGGAP